MGLSATQHTFYVIIFNMPDPIEFPTKDPYASFSQTVEENNPLGRFEVSLSEGQEKLIGFEVDSTGALITTIPSAPGNMDFLISLAATYFDTVHEEYSTIPEPDKTIVIGVNGNTTFVLHEGPNTGTAEVTLSNHRFKELPYPINALVGFAIGAKAEALPEAPVRAAIDTALQERARIIPSM